MTSFLNKRSGTGTQFYHDWKPIKSIDILHKNFQEDHTNSRRFPGFPGVVDTLLYIMMNVYTDYRSAVGMGWGWAQCSRGQAEMGFSLSPCRCMSTMKRHFKLYFLKITGINTSKGTYNSPQGAENHTSKRGGCQSNKGVEYSHPLPLPIIIIVTRSI